MARTITVKGVGKATVKPDQVVIRMNFETKDKSYDRAMSLAAEQVLDLKKAFADAGFGKDALKRLSWHRMIVLILCFFCHCLCLLHDC